MLCQINIPDLNSLLNILRYFDHFTEKKNNFEKENGWQAFDLSLLKPFLKKTVPKFLFKTISENWS